MTIDDFSPCADCHPKQCGLIDGNECDKLKEFWRIRDDLERAAWLEEHIPDMYDAIKSNTYTCDVCGSIIFPAITTAGDGKYDVMTSFATIYGGVGNSVVSEHVCDDCVKKMTLHTCHK